MTIFWISFHLVIAFLLALDLLVFHKKAHAVKIKEAAWASAFWIALALLFAGGVWAWKSHEEALTFLAAYLLEKSLSMDNLFVFYILFRHFNIEKKDEHRLLFFGVLGAIIMRALFIAAGVQLVVRFRFLLYIFGLFLLWTGIGMWRHPPVDESDEEETRIIRFLRRFFEVAPGSHSGFAVKHNGKWVLTSSAFALLTIELSDVIFAVDSIPAVLGITHDFFIAYTSNILAILGLRALYFLLAGLIAQFKTLHYGLAFVLSFIGVKMLIADFFHIPILISLGVIAVSVGGTIVYDLTRKESGA